MEARRCIIFGLLRVCDGDIVIIELSRGDVVKGVVRLHRIELQRKLVFIALADSCDSEPMEAVHIKRIARIIKLGECREPPRLDGDSVTTHNHG